MQILYIDQHLWKKQKFFIAPPRLPTSFIDYNCNTYFELEFQGTAAATFLLKAPTWCLASSLPIALKESKYARGRAVSGQADKGWVIYARLCDRLPRLLSCSALLLSRSVAVRCSLCYQLIWELLAKQCNRISSDLIGRRVQCTYTDTHINTQCIQTHKQATSTEVFVVDEQRHWWSLLIQKSINTYRGRLGRLSRRGQFKARCNQAINQKKNMKTSKRQSSRQGLPATELSCPRAEQCIITDNDLCIVNVGMGHLLFWLGHEYENWGRAMIACLPACVV